MNPAVESHVPWGREILGFVDASVLADTDELPEARGELLDQAGPEVVMSVAGVIATFQLMNRLVDAVGAPIDERFDDFLTDLGLERPEHLPGERR